MGPLEIARSRLHDLALGADVHLFDQASAHVVAQYLEALEGRYDALRAAVIPLLSALDNVELSGLTQHLIPLIRSRDTTAKELNQ